MKVKDLVRKKGFEVIAIDAGATVADAIKKMVERNIGAVLVMDEGKTAGMFTERDVLKCWSAGHGFDEVAIKDVMAKNLFVAETKDDLSYAMSIMIQKNVRHLPVVEDGRVVSVLSIRDVVKAQVSNLEMEVHYLKDLIMETG